MILIDPGLV